MSPHHRCFDLAVRFVCGREQFIPIGCAERGEINGQTVLVGKGQRDFGDFRRRFKRGLPHLKKRGLNRWAVGGCEFLQQSVDNMLIDA